MIKGIKKGDRFAKFLDEKYFVKDNEGNPIKWPGNSAPQNYSKEYLDNMQELQAVCDAQGAQPTSCQKLIRRFKSGAVRGDNTGRVRPDWISPYAIEEISKVLIENANDFGACNYFLGIDEEACLESMARHIEELKEAILIKKDMAEAKVIARSVGFNAVAMLHTMVLKEKGLYKEHFDATELVTVEEAKKSNRFVG